MILGFDLVWRCFHCEFEMFLIFDAEFAISCVAVLLSGIMHRLLTNVNFMCGRLKLLVG